MILSMNASELIAARHASFRRVCIPDGCVYYSGVYIERGINRKKNTKVYDKILKLFSNMHKHISRTYG